MPTSLPRTAQVDFAAGAWKDSVAWHLVSSRGVWDIENGLLDDDGSIYRRGGAEYLSTSAFGSSLRAIWDGFLGVGQRTLLANPNDFGTLDASEGPINLGGTGLSLPARAVELGGVVIMDRVQWAGSRKTAAYSTGTVSVTNGSKTVTGAGTTWNTLVDAGMLMQLAPGSRAYPIESIDSTTQVTLREPYAGSTAAGQAYTFYHLLDIPTNAGKRYAIAANRLFVIEGDNRVAFSPRDIPYGFAATDYHALPQGANILGGAGLGNRLLLFATNGMWTIDGLDFSIVDQAGNQQHIVRHVNEDLILLNHEGLTTWAGRLVAPCADGVYLVDGLSAPMRISRAFDGLWRSYVAAGYLVGLATVFRSQLLLPIIDSNAVVRDQIVVRLDRPVQTSEGIIYPYSRLAGYGANVAAWAVRAGGQTTARNPALLGASVGNGRVLKGNSFFAPTAAVKNDPDGTTHRHTIELAARPAKEGFGLGTVRRARARYELEDAGSDNPTVELAYRTGPDDSYAVVGTGDEDDGQDPPSWRLVKKCRYVQFRLQVTAPAAKMVLRSFEHWSRPSGKA